MEQHIDAALERLYSLSAQHERVADYLEVSNYIEQLERANFGLRQQVANLKEKDAKRW